jgi:spermidine/putrescine transport system permease protein
VIGASSPRRWRNGELLATAAPASLTQALFFLVPLVLVVVMSFQVMQQFQLVWSWDLTTWHTIFSRPHFWWTLVRTIAMSAICVVLCLAIAFPVAYCMVTRLTAWDTHIKLLIVFAFLTDLVLKTYGWVLILDQEGLLNHALRATGLVEPSFDHGFIFTPAATMLGMVVNLLPFMIFALYLSLSAMDRDLLFAAYDAGATPLQAFLAVTVPLARPGIWAGSAFVFILSMGSLLEERVLGGGKAPMMGSLIRQTFETRVNWPLGAALTIILVTASAGILVAASRLYRVPGGAR